MSSPRGLVRWIGIYGCGFLSFLLDPKGPKSQGRHQRPTALGDRPSAMSATPPRPARVNVGVPSPSGLRPLPLPSSRTETRDLLSTRDITQNIIFQHYIRQQTTTNDYCRQQTFVQRLSLDIWCFFVFEKIKTTSIWKHLNLFTASQPKNPKAKNELD